jgi:large subunit ribosomal protein L6
MSRIGKQPIPIPEGVDVDIAPGRVAVKGPRGELTQAVSPEMKVELADSTLTVTRPTDRGPHRALHGLTRSLVANMVEGVTNGYERRLEIQGVGYRARLQGRTLELNVGFSHPMAVEAPEGIEFELPQPTQVIVRGIDKQLVGETAARIRRVRPPEPYKGKGIRYAGEQVRRKVGKRA